MTQKWNWENIVDVLVKECQHNKYAKDEKMPSENKMAVRFGVPRSEIRKAYARLKEMGYIYSMQGYGSFFSGKRRRVRLSLNDVSFSAKMAALGLDYQAKNIGCKRVSGGSLIHTMLEIPYDEPVYKTSRLRILDGEPAAIHISYLPERLFPTIASDGNSITSVYDYLHSHGHPTLKTENNQLTVAAPSKKERSLLDLQGYASCLVLTCKCISQPSGAIVEIARTVYRSDRFIFELDET